MTSPLERLTSALSDRYRLEREFGAGGIATAYLAQDLKHDRRVAIKVLRPELAAGPVESGEAAPHRRCRAHRHRSRRRPRLRPPRHHVIHRDITPENILRHDGRALVADFGIALAASTAGGSRMTETGMSLGTPTYMSLEQAMGERESPRGRMGTRWGV
ncbi:MAG: hypothetical protein SGJ01_14075 [Gemmatimonadota bacterium]|nr:hypothetical protein [Gemmatimonadota bacterium]